MQTVGAYTLVTALGVCEVGTVWSAFDTTGHRYTIAVLDAAASRDRSWREAFRSAATELSETAGGLPVVEADFDADTPWVACSDEPGPGAAQIFLALGLQYQMIAVSAEYPQVDPPADDNRTDRDRADEPAGTTGGAAPVSAPAAQSSAPPAWSSGGGTTDTATLGATDRWGSGGFGASDRSDPWGVDTASRPVSTAPASGVPADRWSSPGGLSTAPASGMPVSTVPASGVPGDGRWSGASPVSGTPAYVGPAPVSGGPVSGGPVGPVSGLPGMPISSGPNSSVSSPGFGGPGNRYATAEPAYFGRHTGRRQGRTLVLLAVVAVLALAVGTTVGALVVGDKGGGTAPTGRPQAGSDVDLGLPSAPPSQPGVEPPQGGGWPSEWPKFRSADQTRSMSNLDGLGFSFQVPPDWECTKTGRATGYAKYTCGVGDEIGGEIIVRNCRPLCSDDRRAELRKMEEAWGLPWIKSGPFATWLETTRIDGAERYGLAYVAYWRSVPEDAIDRQLVLRMTAPPGRADEVRKVANSIRDVTFTL